MRHWLWVSVVKISLVNMLRLVIGVVVKDSYSYT